MKALDQQDDFGGVFYDLLRRMQNPIRSGDGISGVFGFLNSFWLIILYCSIAIARNKNAYGVINYIKLLWS